jgi:Tol biopolymer transport system component
MKRALLLFLIFMAGYGIVLSQTKKIVYTSDDNQSGYYQVFIMNEDGSGKRQLTDMSANCFFPKWSPDGNKIVFNTEDGRIFFVDNVNSDKPDDPYYVFGGVHPSFATDGESVFFNSDHDGTLTIYNIELKASEESMVSDLGYSNQQVISRDGSKIVFSCFYGEGKDIILIDFDDTTNNNVYKISNNDNANLYPDISSDNMMIVFASFNNNLEGTIHIYKGGTETALSKGIESATRPKFSPDDSKIAFLSIGGSTVKLYTMNIDGSGRQAYDIKGGNVANYMWIDKERILYDAENSKNYDVGILNINTGKSELLTEKGSNMHPDILN